jgi:cell division protein FtsL
MKIGRIKPRWTLGGLMLLIAVVALPLAWYSYRAREIVRQQAVADLQRSKIEARINQLLKSMEDQHTLEQARISDEIARSTAPTEPSDRSIPERATTPPAQTVEQPR